MERADIYARLNDIFSEVLGESVALDDDTTADDVEGWDSLTHIELMSEVEDAFGFKLSMKELLELRNVGELVDIISAKATN